MRKNLLLSSAAVLLFAAPAFAADLPSRRVEPMAPVMSVPPLFTWTGFYVGANAGWQWSQGDRSINNINVIGGVAGGQGGDSDGFTAGGTLGYNWQYNQFVFGVEGDINYVDDKRSTSFSNSATINGVGYSNSFNTKSEMNWLGTARARIGVTYDRFLIYGTGGFAFADLDDSTSITSTSGGLSTLSTGGGSDTRWGWTLGAGVEYAFMNNWSTKLEYLYYKLEDKSYSITGPVGSVATFKSKPEGSILRAGINYRFSTY